MTINDQIECTDDLYKPAVAYAVGSALVCDSLEEAQDLCFERGERPDRWEEKEIDKLRKKKVELEEQLQKCQSSATERQQLSDMENRLRIQYAETDMKAVMDKLAATEQQNRLKADLEKKLRQEQETARRDESRLGDNLTELQNYSREVEAEVFADFSAEVGINNIR
eukprot:gene24272-31553_t